jgi:hypothetical protein
LLRSNSRQADEAKRKFEAELRQQQEKEMATIRKIQEDYQRQLLERQLEADREKHRKDAEIQAAKDKYDHHIIDTTYSKLIDGYMI